MSSARLLARCPAPVAPLPPQGSAPTLTFSMPRTLTFSMPIDTQSRTTDLPLVMGKLPGFFGRLPRRRRQAARHSLVTARSLPHTAFPPTRTPRRPEIVDLGSGSAVRICP